MLKKYYFDHTNTAANVDFTAVQKRVDLVDIKIRLQSNHAEK